MLFELLCLKLLYFACKLILTDSFEKTSYKFSPFLLQTNSQYKFLQKNLQKICIRPFTFLLFVLYYNKRKEVV